VAGICAVCISFNVGFKQQQNRLEVEDLRSDDRVCCGFTDNHAIVLMDIITQLVEIYFKEEPWHNRRMAFKDAVDYHTRLLEQGNINVYSELGVVLGYMEVWHINFEQLGRIVCKENFSAYHENITDGNIAYLANIWVDKNFRRTSVFNVMKIMFFSRHCNCDYFVGESMTKKSQLIKVFKREQLQSNLYKKGA